jgi:hypothetical protein
VSVEQVRGVMDAPPDFIEVSYLPAWRAGRISTDALACGVVAALRHSPYDGEVVDEVTNVLVSLGYGAGGVAAVRV